VFRNVQIRSKLLAIVAVPLLALVVLATVQVVRPAAQLPAPDGSPPPAS
jgi:hypothetical protein